MITPKSPATLTDLEGLTVGPPPEDAGGYWQGVSHYQLLRAMADAARELGWEATHLRCHLGKGGNDMAASYDLLRYPMKATDPHQLSVGVLNYPSQEVAPRLYGGIRSGIGGIVMDEFILGKRTQSTTFNLTQRVAKQMKNLTARLHDYMQQKLLLQKMQAEDGAAERLAQAGREGLMPWSRVGRVDRIFQSTKMSAWDLLEAFATVTARGPTLWAMPRSLQFYQLLTT